MTYALTQSPVRRLSQRHAELRAFLRLLRRAEIDLVGARILDARCGTGYGLELLARTFRPSRLVGFDALPEPIPEDDGAFDAAFVFGILHHVAAWRRGLVEVARVLRPGGALLVEALCGDEWVEFRDVIASARLRIDGEVSLVPGAVRSFLARKAC